MTMATSEADIEYVTVTIGGQPFGVPIARVLDVFAVEKLARVPLAAPEIAGVLNMRGRIVTAIDMRRHFGLPAIADSGTRMAVGVEWNHESYGLLVDGVGEVLKLPASARQPNPANLEPSWARVAAGVHQLDAGLLVVLDVDRIFDTRLEPIAA